MKNNQNTIEMILTVGYDFCNSTVDFLDEEVHYDVTPLVAAKYEWRKCYDLGEEMFLLWLRELISKETIYVENQKAYRTIFKVGLSEDFEVLKIEIIDHTQIEIES